MNIVNLTPHVLNVHADTIGGDIVLNIEPSGQVARVSCKAERTSEMWLTGEQGTVIVPFYENFYGDVEGLPSPVPGTIYIVSGMVLDRVSKERNDVFAPGELVRDEQGRPIGCRGLRR